MQSTDAVKNKVQIIHCDKRHHWIVATTVKCENGQVLVIDSLYKSIDDETKSTVCRLFQSEEPPVIKVVNPQRQKGGVKTVDYLPLPLLRQLHLMQTQSRKDLSRRQCGPILQHVFNATKSHNFHNGKFCVTIYICQLIYQWTTHNVCYHFI